MEFFKPGKRYNFLALHKPAGFTSVVAVAISWILVMTVGINWGIDFAGGTEALLAFNESVDVGELRDVMGETGLDHPEIVTYGLADEGRYFIRSRTQSLLSDEHKDKIKASVVAKLGEPKLWDASDESGEEIRVQFENQPEDGALLAALKDAGFPTATVGVQTEGSNPVAILRLPGVRARIVEAVTAKYGKTFKSVDRLESVGSAVGQQMRGQAAEAVLYALLLILLYISFRFDLRYSPGAIVALLHDVSITLGIFVITGMEFNLPIVAALLAIVGYSLNDTIVVYDRIRESLKLGLGKDMAETINWSISDCLSRTVLTSVTTFIAVLSIYVFGGGIIQNFAFAMLVGVVVGTYSSIYIASPLVLVMDGYLARQKAAGKKRATARNAHP